MKLKRGYIPTGEMVNLVFDNFTEAYVGLAKLLRDEHEYEASPRGKKVKESLGVRFEITNPLDRIPYIPARKFSMQYVIAESLWYLSGNNQTEWIANYAPFWNNITDDGKTANSAYGARLFKENNKIAGGRINQWEYIKEELKNDPDSRRAVMHIRVPDDSIDAKLDVPCTLALQFFIRDGKLNLMVNMRSSDLILGIAYDIPAFTLFQELMALELGVELGRYIHVSNSLHVYEQHFDMLNEIANSEKISVSIHSRRGPVEPIPGKLDINGIFEFENKIRNCKSYAELDKIVLDDTFTFTNYERDWSLILAAHQAKKIGEKGYCRELMNTVSRQLRPIREI